MTIVSQYNKYACFAACLESFLRDIGRDFDHDKFVKANLDLFCGGQDIEGCCNSVNFIEAADRVGIVLEFLQSPATFELFKYGILLHLHWNADSAQNHCVRLQTIENGELSIINPLKSDSLDKAPESWIRGAMKLSLK